MVPIATFIFQKIKVQYTIISFQKSRRTLLLSRQTNDDETNALCENELITECLLLCKPVSYLDIYLKLVGSELQLTDNQQQTLFSHKMQVNLSQQLNVFCAGVDKQFQVLRRYQPVPTCAVNNLVYCYNKVFFNLFDFVFTFDNLELKLFAQIPRFGFIRPGVYDALRFGGNMFSVNNKLYCHDGSSRLFLIHENGRLKCVSRKRFNTVFYQFMGKVFAFDQINMYSVNNGGGLTLVKPFQYQKVLYQLNEMLVVQGINKKVAVNLSTGEATEMGQKDYIGVGRNGAEIRVATEINAEQHNSQSFGERNEALKKLEKQTAILLLRECPKIIFQSKYNALHDKLKQVSEAVFERQKSINKIVNEVVQTQRMYVSAFSNITEDIDTLQ
ncbi:Hypothetical_protein [Hexamita inflata]|uniref:Hypothetical_protein n=1 Tax=Hexamita inflata TaxID=28002 RepID=A0ABP1J4M0_9EUKA